MLNNLLYRPTEDAKLKVISKKPMPSTGRLTCTYKAGPKLSLRLKQTSCIACGQPAG